MKSAVLARPAITAQRFRTTTILVTWQNRLLGGFPPARYAGASTARPLATPLPCCTAYDSTGKATATVVGPDALTLKFTLKTGQFAGTFKHPISGHAISFKGLMLQTPVGGRWILPQRWPEWRRSDRADCAVATKLNNPAASRLFEPGKLIFRIPGPRQAAALESVSGHRLTFLGASTISKAMKLTLTAVFQKVHGGYVAFVEELPGANTQGKTLAEARTNLVEAVRMVLEANRELAEETVAGHEVIREPFQLTAA